MSQKFIFTNKESEQKYLNNDIEDMLIHLETINLDLYDLTNAFFYKFIDLNTKVFDKDDLENYSDVFENLGHMPYILFHEYINNYIEECEIKKQRIYSKLKRYNDLYKAMCRLYKLNDYVNNYRENKHTELEKCYENNLPYPKLYFNFDDFITTLNVNDVNEILLHYNTDIVEIKSLIKNDSYFINEDDYIYI